jgi:predicted unusual protein kinase regulating ubiquinone biosynthesis (AarF/ABC1/UbiB family)
MESAPEPGSGQESIRSTPLSRMAALAGAGASVGMNYLKYYGRRAVTAQTPATATAAREALDEANAGRLYETFSQLKGGPLKLAQMLSMDDQLLPAAYSTAFAQAQYSAPPLSWPLVRRTIEREFRQPVEALYDQFTSQAAHGASIGQVHRAVLRGREVAVKVQYPGVAESLTSDLRVVKPVALQMLGLREADVAHYFKEVETRLLEETDYVNELRRSCELAAACAGLAHVRFPGFHPDRCSARVLTMDWIDGQPLDRFADSTASQAVRNQIGQALWDFYDWQVHTLLLFHADPHPGNFLVQDGALWVLDFGCTRAITREFHDRQFALLDPAVLDHEPAFLQALRDLDILLPGDNPDKTAAIVALARQSIDLLAKPLRSTTFDFADPAFMKAIYDMGDANRKDKSLRQLRGARGPAESVYLNRAYFGLYSLLHRLKAEVVTQRDLSSPPL